MPERYPPEDPREWLNRAHSDLVLASQTVRGVYWEDLCFHAQQAVEKAIKGLLTARQVDFPYVHDIAQLLALLENSGVSVPERLRGAAGLTPFAVFTRYPGVAPAVTEEKYREALALAEGVVRWAEEALSRESR